MADPMNDPHRGEEIRVEGEPLESAEAAMILLHGRGGSADEILSLGQHLGATRFALLAPQASDNTWYPYSFLRPMDQNEPYLSSALATVARVLEMVGEAGIPVEQTILAGFSQGACLATEFVARNAARFGGLLGFSGGLIGPPGTPREYDGSLEGMPAFLGCSDVDAHIPEERVDETETVLTGMGAEVDKRIYPGMAHTINRDELEAAAEIVKSVGG